MYIRTKGATHKRKLKLLTNIFQKFADSKECSIERNELSAKIC